MGKLRMAFLSSVVPYVVLLRLIILLFSFEGRCKLTLRSAILYIYLNVRVLKMAVLISSLILKQIFEVKDCVCVGVCVYYFSLHIL